jgi:large subunit ribosomal protein L4
MLSTTLYTKLGEAVGTVDLPEALFGAPVNTAVLHQVVTAQLAGRHLGTHDTKTRGEVRGGGAKPYRQKGTGRARQGSRRAPHYAGGGAVFGPHPRSYDQKVPRRMKRLALRGALTAKYGDGAIKVVRDLAMEAIRTRELLDYLEALESATGEILVVAQARDEKLELSARNLPHVSVILADSLNTVAILKARVLLITEPALAAMTEVYA